MRHEGAGASEIAGSLEIPASRATADATTPGSIAAATIRSFSAFDHRRRRRPDVVPSPSVFVIKLSPKPVIISVPQCCR